MARLIHPVRVGIVAGRIPDYPVLTLEEVSVICRPPGRPASYKAGWKMVSKGVRHNGRLVKLRGTQAVGGTVVEQAAVRDFLRKLNPVTRRAAAGKQEHTLATLRRGEIGTYDLPKARQVSLQRAGTNLSEVQTKAESSGRARRATHGKGRTGVN